MRKTLLLTAISLVLLASAALAAQAFWIDGYRYYPLYSICEKKNIEYAWDSIGRVATLKKNGVEAKIRVGSDKILVNGEGLKDIGPPLSFHKGMVVIPASFANRRIDGIFKYRARPKTYTKKKRSAPAPTHTIKTIVLDPGHGGKDPGAVGRYRKIREKDINLDIAKRLKRLLSHRGIRVYLTRDRDNFVSLSKRSEFANKKNADFFISIHANASRSKNLRGFEIYYLKEGTLDNERARRGAANVDLKAKERSIDKHNPIIKAIVCDMEFTENRVESKELSKYLLREVKKKKIYTRRNSLRYARFHILKNIKTDMPAILVEVGYISNRKEEGLLSLSSYRQKVAEGLAKGILTYKAEYERTNGFTD